MAKLPWKLTAVMLLILLCNSVAAASGQLQIMVTLDGQDVSDDVQIMIMEGAMPHVLPPGTPKIVDLPAGTYDVMAILAGEETMAMPAESSVEVTAGETVELTMELQALPGMLPGIEMPDMPDVPEPAPAPAETDALAPKEADTEQLLELLTSGGADEQKMAAEELSQWQRRREAVPQVLALLESDHPELRRRAMQVLTGLGSEPPDGAVVGKRPIDEHMDVFVDYLQDADPELQRGALQIVAAAWYFPDSAIPALLDFLKDADPELRRLAAEALSSRGTRPEQYADSLLEGLAAALQDTDVDVRRLAATALSRLHHDPELVARTAGQALSDVDSDVQMAALGTLRSLEESAAAADAQLIDALNAGDPAVRAEVLRTLREYPQHLLVQRVEPIAATLSDPDDRVRMRAVEALALMGAEALPALPQLTEVLDDSDWRVAAGAVQIMFRFFGEQAAPAQEALLQLIQHEDLQFQEPALGAGLALGYIGAPAVPALHELLSHQEAIVRYRAATALNNVGPPAEKTVPKLRTLMDDEEEHGDVRRAAYFAIESITGETPDW